MAQAKVPKFIDVQDKVVAGLTLWQAIDLGTAGISAALLFVLLKNPVGKMLAFFCVVAGVCFAFVKINERSFGTFLFAALKFAVNPKNYIWHKENPRIKIREHKKSPFDASRRAGGEGLTVQKIKELATALDVDTQVRKS
ncbi:MAG: hypothetical protein A3A80_02320 [Candidatus Terrybacteria bacterium RIFCSPLOWO2_01_FULL_44_24]|uniref:PrgI family protein n=1 Tax=Candidatus Terrybacteria bacterium RIFCSPHIGHO2_01_FULL_43_35 TaxID=1802361 RepID=A0A1G2PEB5_9BACT|nr:MAG: hypothetical protein A2828_02110 [Candidatus Terrybacteria bacterium RIFCSPHIGHO2_01_FULL_43_35]OHA50914.1 MAG: hypothetical protein A3A80_02320 [Candidatus Terrybacteria bacterium RIFCSPLOWO2_01_FULL_44_24]